MITSSRKKRHCRVVHRQHGDSGRRRARWPASRPAHLSRPELRQHHARFFGNIGGIIAPAHTGRIALGCQYSCCYGLHRGSPLRLHRSRPRGQGRELTRSSIRRPPPERRRTLTGPAYNGGFDGDHYSSLAQINRSNVSQLRIAWQYDTGEKGGLQTNPLIVGRVSICLHAFGESHCARRGDRADAVDF
jgi:hypothetical protein